ncbi:hypothetical protein [Lactobacillus sp. PSON]|uniref:hypothetical protein n=1 Tax=Lactobacillus sp. PSON TaxID=3455454 RepID=UPI0040410CCC
MRIETEKLKFELARAIEAKTDNKSVSVNDIRLTDLEEDENGNFMATIDFSGHKEPDIKTITINSDIEVSEVLLEELLLDCSKSGQEMTTVISRALSNYYEV